MSVIVLFSALLVGTVLHTAAELDSFSDDSRRRYTPFCVTGTVQAVNTPDNLMVFSDSSGWTEIRIDSAHRPVPGERVVATGVAHLSSHQEIDIVARTMQRVGTDAVEPPLELRLGDITELKHHLRTVVTEGTVIDSFRDEIDSHNHFLILKDADVILPVALPVGADSTNDLGRLRDARVRVSGRFMRTVSGERKFSGPFISGDGRDSVAVLTPAPTDPFAVPALEKKPYRTPREIARLGKRSVRGEVLAVWDGNLLMVRTPDDRIVNVTLAHGQSVPRPGLTVTAAGYPETDLFRVNLSRAVIREEDQSPAPAQEPAITDLRTIFDAIPGTGTIDHRCHGRLLRCRGTVQSGPSPESAQRRLLLACGPFKLPVDLGLHPEAAADLALGTEIEVTGRCLLEIDNWRPDDIFPRIRNLVAVIRAPDDIRVISRPPWWTPQRLLFVIAGLVLALIGIWTRNRILRHMAAVKVAERTRLAVELHDSMSQTLAGVACQVAAGANAIDDDPAAARRRIDTAGRMLKSCRTELRHCLFDLRSDTLEEPDFSAAIRKTLGQLDDSANIAVRVGIPRRLLVDSTAHAILAIVRELTGNAISHGGASEVRIAGSVENGQALLSVRDNGCGFDPKSCDGPLQGHFGLEGIRDRLRKLGGSISIDSCPGKGTKARIAITLKS